jgi:hypothetical protein
MLEGRDEGDCNAELKPGLVGPVENVDEVGVLNPPGDCAG